MAKINRDFKGVWIPKELYLNTDLSWSEKLLLIEIDSLDNDKDRGCYASNQWFAEFLNLKNPQTVGNMISKLRKEGYIEFVFFDGRNRGLRSAFRSKTVNKSRKNPHKKVGDNPHKKVGLPPQKNGTEPPYFYGHNNTVKELNNTHTQESVCETASRPEEKTETDAEYANFRYQLTDWYEDVLDSEFLPPGSVAERDVRYLFANRFSLPEIAEYYEVAKHDQWRKGPVTISAIAKGIAHWRSGQTTTAAPERPDFSNCPLGCDPDTGLIYVSDNGNSGMKRCTHKAEINGEPENAKIRS